MLVSFCRLAYPKSLRMTIEADDTDDEDSDGTPVVFLSSSLHNSKEHHMDGRFPPSPAVLKLPLHFAQAIMYLLQSYPKYVRVDSIPMSVPSFAEHTGSGDEDEEDATSSEQSQRSALLVTIWQSGLLTTKK